MKKQLLPFALSLCFLAPAFAQDAPPSNAARQVQGADAAPDNPRPAGALDVRDFGARGDAKTDDTAAFQAALNAASTRGGVAFRVSFDDLESGDEK